jgi:hypothetical protein
MTVDKVATARASSRHPPSTRPRLHRLQIAVISQTAPLLSDVPPRTLKASSRTHLVHWRKVPRVGVTAGAAEVAFRGCDDEPAQTDRGVGL